VTDRAPGSGVRFPAGAVRGVAGELFVRTAMSLELGISSYRVDRWPGQYVQPRPAAPDHKGGAGVALRQFG